MCGVIGVHLKNVTDNDFELVGRLFRETMIRGKHATGVSYVKHGQVHTDKAGIPVTEFFRTRNVADWVNEDGGLYLIGHIRYSTSDVRYNQPFDNGYLAIAHNGVISQEDPSGWEYECETANDSELILRALEHNAHPLWKYWDRSMAVVTITSDKLLTGFRNHERPLYANSVDNGIIFTSTKDIALRSGLDSAVKCEMFTLYTYMNDAWGIERMDPNKNVMDLQS